MIENLIHRLIAAACLILLINSSSLFSQAPSAGLPGEVHTRITTSRVQQFKIVVAPMPTEGISDMDIESLAGRIREIILDDLNFSLRFDLVNRRVSELSLVSLSTGRDMVDFDGWKGTGADYLVAGSFSVFSGIPQAEIRIYDISLRELVFLKSYDLDKEKIRRGAHKISDDVVLNVTGERGIANTRIAFIAKGRGNSTEVYYSDYDGYNLVQVTRDSSVAKMPNWNIDGSKISYTIMKNDFDLWMTDLTNGKSEVLQSGQGVDQAAEWCESNGFLAWSSGFSGDQEIYSLAPGAARPMRLTYSGAMDIEPSWSPNGAEIAFTSTRAGNPHIFIMGSDGLNLRRLTFESRNTTPDWRPMPHGDKILMTSEIRGVFQIAIIDITGDNFIQLTTESENRHACWSPDGLHVVFASDRRGGRGNFEIFTMDWDGGSQRPLRDRYIPAKEPDWSPYLNW